MSGGVAAEIAVPAGLVGGAVAAERDFADADDAAKRSEDDVDPGAPSTLEKTFSGARAAVRARRGHPVPTRTLEQVSRVVIDDA